MKDLDMRDIAIIDAFPTYDCQKKVLNVGCGEGRIDYHLALDGYRVYATDIKKPEFIENIFPHELSLHRSDIFELPSFPIQSSPIVICSEVLEHLKEYKLALIHLLALTEIRLIITVPWRRSFNAPGHCNYWNDMESKSFKNIHEFIKLSKPYSIAISKIITKSKDVGKQLAYLIVIDKRQEWFDRDDENSFR